MNGEWEHLQHCLDTLRQDIMCHADDTPLYGRLDTNHGHGQVVQCRDWNKLIAWSQDLERNACYHQISDYREVIHGIEKYAFCPPGSPYGKAAEDYFKKWGHKELYAK